MTFNPSIVITSRRESSRIPEKCFKKVAGLPAIEHILSRLKGIKVKKVLAVPCTQEQHYYGIANRHKVELFLGNPDSPLHRIAEYLKENPLVSHIVRVTHDDIILDIQTIKEMLAVAKDGKVGYVSCPSIIEGAGVEVIARENILYAAKHNGDTEFISYFVRGEGLPLSTSYKFIARDAVNRPYRLTMDYMADWQVLNTVLTHLGKSASTENICRYLDHHPELLTINTLPLLTFYTCCHNAGATIGKTIASVLSTGFERMEYIIVDDGSTDNTISEIAKFSRDSRVRLVVNEKNKGLASSSNIALGLSRGRFIMRVDADDMLMPESFKTAFYDMKRDIEGGAIAVYPAYYEIGDGHSGVQGKVNHHAGCCLMLRSALNEMRFKDGIRHWDGLELYKRLKRRESAIAYYPYPIWFYRVSSKSMSNTQKGTRAKMLLTLGLSGLRITK